MATDRRFWLKGVKLHRGVARLFMVAQQGTAHDWAYPLARPGSGVPRGSSGPGLGGSSVRRIRISEVAAVAHTAGPPEGTQAGEHIAAGGHHMGPARR